jgi:hypothetical protein
MQTRVSKSATEAIRQNYFAKGLQQVCQSGTNSFLNPSKRQKANPFGKCRNVSSELVIAIM